MTYGTERIPRIPGLSILDILYYTTVGADTFTKADYPGLKAIIVECQGSGGGAPTITGTTTAGDVAVTGGGSGGGYARSLIPVSNLDITEAITVPAGGTTDGADAIFDTISGEVRGVGGLVGVSSGVVTPAVTVATGGAAPTGSVGDFLVRGGAGAHGFAQSVSRVYPGTGGNAFLGHGGQSPIISGSGVGSGVPGTSYGGGAGGNGRAQSQSGATGTSSGGQGIVIVTLLV